MSEPAPKISLSLYGPQGSGKMLLLQNVIAPVLTSLDLTWAPGDSEHEITIVMDAAAIKTVCEGVEIKRDPITLRPITVAREDDTPAFQKKVLTAAHDFLTNGPKNSVSRSRRARMLRFLNNLLGCDLAGKGIEKGYGAHYLAMFEAYNARPSDDDVLDDNEPTAEAIPTTPQQALADEIRTKLEEIDGLIVKARTIGLQVVKSDIGGALWIQKMTPLEFWQKL
jgi:hypothetical protein